MPLPHGTGDRTASITQKGPAQSTESDKGQNKGESTDEEGHVEALNEGGRPCPGSRALSEQVLPGLISLRRPCDVREGTG